MSEIKDELIVEAFKSLRMSFQKGDYTVLVEILKQIPIEKLEEIAYVDKITVMFEGIDHWNRPVFKSTKTKSRYGSVDFLFNYNTSEKEVLEIISEKDLLYFGNNFGCEPMGNPCKNLKILIKGEK